MLSPCQLFPDEYFVNSTLYEHSTAILYAVESQTLELKAKMNLGLPPK